MKKIFILSFLSIILISIPNFSSTIPSSWAKEGVEQIESLDLFSHNLDYHKPITREEFVNLLIPFLDHYIADKEFKVYRNFADVPFVKAKGNNLMIAGGWGILTGLDGNRANPKGLITREQVTAMIERSMRYIEKHTPINIPLKGLKVSDFKDSKKISSWAISSIDYAINRGLMNGVGENSFNPSGNLTVEQSLYILNNMYNIINTQYVKELDLNLLDTVENYSFSNLYTPQYLEDRETRMFKTSSAYFKRVYDSYNLTLLTDPDEYSNTLYGYIYEPNSLLKVNHADITNYTTLSELKSSTVFKVLSESLTTITYKAEKKEVISYIVVRNNSEYIDYLPIINFYCDKNSGAIIQVMVLYHIFD